MIKVSTKKVYTVDFSVIPITNDPTKAIIRAQYIKPYTGGTRLLRMIPTYKAYNLYAKNPAPIMTKQDYETATFDYRVKLNCCICKKNIIIYDGNNLKLQPWILSKGFFTTTRQISLGVITDLTHLNSVATRNFISHYYPIRPNKQAVLAYMHKQCKDIYNMNPLGYSFNEYSH